MKKESGTVDRRRQVDSPSPQRHLPLVDLLVDTRAELMELAVAPGLKVLHTMFADTDPLNRRVVEQMLVGDAPVRPESGANGGRDPYARYAQERREPPVRRHNPRRSSMPGDRRRSTRSISWRS